MTVTTESIITIIRGLIKDLLNPDGRNAFEYDTDNAFKLSTNRISSSSIRVFKNGTEIFSPDWSYNSSTNKVTITPITTGLSLVKGDNIVITFSFYEKYSDTELTGYIKSNLVQFTKHQYRKTFYMNCNDEVVAYNDENPTLKEGHIIALVTAIDIDPQNVKLHIVGDFNISPAENKSKSEQLYDLFNYFQKYYGVIEFLENK